MMFARSLYSPSGALTPSNNDIIEYQDISLPSGASITVAAQSNVTIRKNRIHFKGGQGIITSGSCPGLSIEDNEFVYESAAGASIYGPTANGLWYAIYLQAGAAASVLRNKVVGGNGIFLGGLTSSTVQYFQHINQREGSFGASIAFDNGTSGVDVSDFTIRNDLKQAWTGDNVNMFGASHGNTISRGTVDGNNHPLGCGLIIENGSHDNIVTDIDLLRWGQGGFFAHGTNSDNNQFIRCRAKLNYWPPTQGRRDPSSAVSPPAFSQLSGAANTTFSECKYGPLSGAASAYYKEGSTALDDITAEDFTPRTPYEWALPN